MDSNGIVKGREEEIADYLVNYGYEPFNVYPVLGVQTGDRIYTDQPEGSHQFLGVHIMDTLDCLEHPDWQPRVQTIHKQFNADFDELHGTRNPPISLDSFELWKFMTLWTRGSFVSYELLYQPTVHCAQYAESLFSLMREGVTNRIARQARDLVVHKWVKNKSNETLTYNCYFRLMQAIRFVDEGDFVWNLDELKEYFKKANLAYSKDKAPEELAWLVDEVERFSITSKLPDQVPNKILSAVRQKIKTTRSRMI